jgi:hypothetical protein
LSRYYENLIRFEDWTMPRKKVIDELVVVKLLKRARSELDNPLEVNRLLREIGKFYDPLTGRAMIDGPSRQRVVSLVERGEKAMAAAAIEQFIEQYQRRIEPDPEGRTSSDRGSPSCDS